MIHIIEKHIQDDTWGKTYVIDDVLPTKIHRIRKIMANIVPDRLTRIKLDTSCSIASGVGSVKYAITNVQGGICNVSVNNTRIIHIMPVHVTKELQNSSYNFNVVEIGGNVIVDNGSSIRIVYEEAENPVFVNKKRFNEQLASFTEWADQCSNKDALIRAFHQRYGQTAIPGGWTSTFTTGYTLKLYIDYD